MYEGAEINTWEIKMPQNIDAMNGFCVHIPCQFEIPDSFKTSLDNSVKAMWKKTTIDGAIALGSGNVIGNILNRNCTTVFHNVSAGFSDMYFFRLEGHEPLLYTFRQGVNITVHKGWNRSYILFLGGIGLGHYDDNVLKGISCF